MDGERDQGAWTKGGVKKCVVVGEGERVTGHARERAIVVDVACVSLRQSPTNPGKASYEM